MEVGALFTDMRHADWSPDGSRFVLTRSTRDGGDVMVTDMAGKVATVLAQTPETELGADWSPDGTTVLYASQATNGEYSIWSVRADGSDRRPLPSPGFPAIAPQWSPDGTRLVFNSVTSDGLRQVYLSSSDGSGVRQLTHNEQGHSDYASWSPDGAWVLFESNRDGTWETYRVRPDGSDLEQITRGGSAGPRYSPDGATIAFHDRRGSDFDIFLIDADGSDERLLVGGPGDQRLPEWSPDGTRIVYVSNAGGHHDLFVVDAASGTTTQITRQPDREFFAVLFSEGREAARVRFDQAAREGTEARVFRDATAPSRHAGWLAAMGDSADAQFLTEIGLEVFPDDPRLLALRDSLQASGRTER